MYKLILSFAFIFAVLFINSCKEDDTVSPDGDTSKLLSYELTYNNENPNLYKNVYHKFVYNNDKIDTIYNIYPSNETTIITKFNYIGNNISEVIKSIIGS